MKEQLFSFSMILFLNRNDQKWPRTRQIKIAGRNHILPPLGIASKTKHKHWSTLNDMHKQQLVYLAYKCYHELSPPTLQSIFSKTDVHRYQLRNKMTYKLPKPNTDFLKKSISFQAVSLWNGLSLELKVKISRTFKEFKKSVKALKL